MSGKPKATTRKTDKAETAAANAPRKTRRAVTLAGMAPITGKVSNRYPCGKIRPEIPPVKIKRILENALLRAENPFLGAPLGWLRLHGIITTTQLSAGVEYARLRILYDRIMGYPRRSSRSFSTTYSGPPMAADEERSIRHHFDELYQKLQKIGYPNVGTRVISLLDDACVDQVATPYGDQELLRIGLDKIAEHFRMSLAVRTQASK